MRAGVLDPVFLTVGLSCYTNVMQFRLTKTLFFSLTQSCTLSRRHFNFCPLGDKFLASEWVNLWLTRCWGDHQEQQIFRLLVLQPTPHVPGNAFLGMKFPLLCTFPQWNAVRRGYSFPLIISALCWMLSGTYPGLADSEKLATQPLLWGASVCTYREGAKKSKGLDLHSPDFWKHTLKKVD